MNPLICQSLVEKLRNSGPLLSSSLFNYSSKKLIFNRCPLKLIAAKFLNKEPALKAFLRVPCRYELSNIPPVFFLEFLHKALFL
jgi:hypothetical protein